MKHSLSSSKSIGKDCWERQAEYPVKIDFHFQPRLNHILVAVGDMESRWALFRAPLFQTVVARLLVLDVVVNPECAGRYQS